MSLGAPPLLQAQASQSPQQAPVVQMTIQQVPLQTARIDRKATETGQWSQPIDHIRIITALSPAPPAYTSAQSEDGN